MAGKQPWTTAEQPWTASKGPLTAPKYTWAAAEQLAGRQLNNTSYQPLFDAIWVGVRDK